MAFSAGPYGAALADGSEYDGSYVKNVTEEQLMVFHWQRLQVSIIFHSVRQRMACIEILVCLVQHTGAPGPGRLTLR